MGSPFDGMSLDKLFEEENRSSEYEAFIVRFLVGHYRLQKAFREYERDLRQLMDGGRPTLELFYTAFPSFPVRLGVSRLTKTLEQFRHHALFYKFNDRQFLREFDKFVELQSDEMADSPLGLAFYCPGRDPTGMVIHNHYYGCDLPGVRLIATTTAGEKLIVEPLKTLIAAIDNDAPGKKWRP